MKVRDLDHKRDGETFTSKPDIGESKNEGVDDEAATLGRIIKVLLGDLYTIRQVLSSVGHQNRDDSKGSLQVYQET